MIRITIKQHIWVTLHRTSSKQILTKLTYELEQICLDYKIHTTEMYSGITRVKTYDVYAVSIEEHTKDLADKVRKAVLKEFAEQDIEAYTNMI